MTRVVLVEDHEALREGLELLLGREGISVVGTAGSVGEALSVVARERPEVAVVDINIGEESGIELTRALLAADGELAVILYTGARQVALLYEGLDVGARGYALKEGAPREIVEAIAVVAGGGTYVDPRLRPALLSREAVGRQGGLSPREREIIELLAEGLTNEAVAERLVLSPETVKTHVRNAMSKLEAKNRVHAIAIALRMGAIGDG